MRIHMYQLHTMLPEKHFLRYFLAGIGKNVYICTRIRPKSLPIDKRWSIFQ
jgi:hypothetical protein